MPVHSTDWRDEAGTGSGPPAEVRLPGVCVSSLGDWRDPYLYGLDLAKPGGGAETGRLPTSRGITQKNAFGTHSCPFLPVFIWRHY